MLSDTGITPATASTRLMPTSPLETERCVELVVKNVARHPWKTTPAPVRPSQTRKTWAQRPPTPLRSAWCNKCLSLACVNLACHRTSHGGVWLCDMPTPRLVVLTRGCVHRARREYDSLQKKLRHDVAEVVAVFSDGTCITAAFSPFESVADVLSVLQGCLREQYQQHKLSLQSWCVRRNTHCMSRRLSFAAC